MSAMSIDQDAIRATEATIKEAIHQFPGELYVLNNDKQPVLAGDDAWAKFYRDEDARLVGEDQIGDVTITTEFEGIPEVENADTGEILLFFTHVWGNDGPITFEHWPSWNAAIEGHNNLVKRYTDEHNQFRK